MYKEATKRVVLKAVAWVSRRKSLRNDIKIQSQTLKIPSSDIKKVEDILKKSLKRWKNYNIYIKSK